MSGATSLGMRTAFFLCCLAVVRQLQAQEDYGNRLGRPEIGGAVYYSGGTNIRMEAVHPSMQKWYIPQELAGAYRHQWDYTNYAQERYLPYREPGQEGDNFYDLYGRFLQKGWLVYDWRQAQPASFQGSSVLKTSQYSSWLKKLVISSDSRGQHRFSVLIGDEIHAMLTPMTFRKTAFNGIMFNYAADRVSATVLASRVSLPVIFTGLNPSFSSNFTNIVGARAVWEIGDFVRLGGTFLNARNGRTGADRFNASPFKGGLTTGQLDGRIDRIVVRLTDDSPQDGTRGAKLFSSDVEIHTILGERDTVLVGSEIGFLPRIRGGTQRDGFLVAEGRGDAGEILMEYVFSDPDPDVADLEAIIPDADLVNNINRVRFLLALGNDYKVEVTSNRQTDNNRGGEQPQFRTVARASDNVKDNSNQQIVVFDYGLPTATQVVGLTLEADDIADFRVYGELNINHHFTQYPTQSRKNPTSSSGIRGDRAAAGWMVNVSRQFFSYLLFGEFFGMDAAYDTSPRFVDTAGRVDWSDTEVAKARHIYDFVDDNDDNDRKNDQQRRFDDGRLAEEQPIGRTPDGFADEAVFPGLDENNDFVADFNQNSLPIRPNFIPDYEEPFLRYGVDRPEYLFALDLNNNGWGDRFENDNEPDYPYRRDRRGYNVYGEASINPETKLSLGQARVSQPSTGKLSQTTYSLLAWQQSFPGWGVLTFYDMFKLVEDDIAEDLVQWVQQRPVLGKPTNSPGAMTPIRDPLGMGDALVNKLALGFERINVTGINTEHKMIHEILWQRKKGAVDRDGQPIERHTRRFGLIDKAEYLRRIGRVSLQARVKQELFMDDTPYSIEKQLGNLLTDRKDWTGILSLQLRTPIMKHSMLRFGLEHMVFRDFVQAEVTIEEDPSGLNLGDPTGDYHETSFAVQLSNTTFYLGYRLLAQIGLRVDKRRIEQLGQKDGPETSALSFISIQAGLGN